MRVTTSFLAWVGLIAGLAAGPAAAQVPVPPRAPTGAPGTPQTPSATSPNVPHNRAVFLGGAAYRLGTSTFSDVREFTVNREQASLTSDARVKEGVGADLTGLVRVRGGLAVGLGVSRVERRGSAEVAGSYPHPFFFDRLRRGGFGTGGLNRTELGVHISTGWVSPAGRRLRLAVFGGPSVFAVRQTAIDAPTLSDVYPYDAITLSAGTTKAVSRTIIGAHSGIDLTWYFTRQLGIGVLGRVTTGSTNASVNDGNDFKLAVTGAQIGAGLRLAF